MANLTMHNIKLQGQVLLGSLPSNPAYHATSAPNGSMWFNSTTGKLMMMVAGSAAVIGDAADITALSVALNAVQADVDANELYGDNDRAAIRSEFAAADATLKGDAAAAYDTLGKLEDKIQAEAVTARAAEAAIQADVNTNESDGDTDRAAIRSEFAVADAAEVVSRNAAITTAVNNLIAAEAAIQADVNTNESDGDTDRALIRTQFAAADAAVQAELDATQSSMGSLMSVAGAYVPFALGGGAYIDGNSSLTEDLVDLDTGLINEVSLARSNEATIQADVDANELDGDNDRALIRSQFAAADAVLKGDAAAAYDTLGKLEDKIQAEAVTARAAEAAIQAAAIAAVQADVNANELDGDNDRALIRSQFATADAAVQAELDATQAAMGSLMSGAGAYVAFALGGGAYIDGNSSLTEDLVDLDTGLINEVSRAGSAEASIQADIDANELDGDNDRALIRSQFAAADAAEVVSRNAAITTAVNNLIDSAPGTLDTLNELAAALGDDADFHTSMTAVHTAATTDRALIRTQFAAADAVLKGDAAAAYDTLGKLEDKIQAEAVTARAAEVANAAAVTAEAATARAAEAAIQADVNTNESDGDTDRALIRTQFAAADAAIQSELDATQASMGSLMSGAGAYVPFALGGGAYIDGNSSLTEDLVDLDTGLINEVSLARSNEATNAAAIAAEAVTARAAEVANAAATAAEAVTARAAEVANAASITAITARFTTVSASGGSYDGSGDHSVQLTHSLSDSAPFVQVMVGGVMMMAPVTFDSASAVTVTLKGVANAAVGTVLVNFFSVA